MITEILQHVALTMEEALRVMPPWFFPAVAFIFGSMVGSFLNVCIHRMPRDQSLIYPGSHCSHCQKPIAWYDNIPLLSYWILGGKCRNCSAVYSMRYFSVELLTAVLFLSIWKFYPPLEALVYMVFASGLVAATFIDFEHLIIPDEITLGGVGVGILLSGVVPIIQSADYHSTSALKSILGALVGFLVLWGVVELGKLLFGRKKIVLDELTAVSLDARALKLQDESLSWEEMFSRESDKLQFEGVDVQGMGKTWEHVAIEVNWKEIRLGSEVYPLDAMSEIKGMTRELNIPREAMGFGDVKFLAAIGAFLGPSAIAFVIFISSFAGSLVGVGTLLIGRREWGAKIPYGPYLALGAFIWIFGGRSWFGDYWMNSMF